jgi:phytanoyl-CoA hydroxylase
MMTLPHDCLAVYQRDGYYVAPGLFRPQEVRAYIDHYMDMRRRQNAEEAAALNKTMNDEAYRDQDPLKIWPRLLQMHRHDELSLRWMLDPRINAHLTGLLGREPFAVQTMHYFKPAGARGQALHQDQFYLRVQPGTCMAAWLALDDCDEENGCLFVVPGSHNWPVLCTVPADLDQSFTDITVTLPEGVQPVPVHMNAGDVMFFNGQLVHGSYPNTSSDRFRRSLIGHYIAGEAEKVGKYYHPVMRMDGSTVEFATAEAGGACGTWVQRDGTPVLEIAGEVVNQKIFGPH